MSKKFSFPEPSCRYHCPHFKSVGPSLNETHYCMKQAHAAGMVPAPLEFAHLPDLRFPE